MKHLCASTALTLALAVAAPAQVQTEVPPVIPTAKPVITEHIKIHGAHLEGNLEGNAVDRDVIVYLPPSYNTDTQRRYPVVYALHGYSIGAEQWSHEIHVPQTVEGAFAQGAREFIVVLPDCKTVHNGCMYSNSVTTGDFEDYIAQDVVSYIDAHYRTIPDRASRGLVGHSMGGYGASRIGMKHPDVFGSLYIMSPCCLSGNQGARTARPGAPNTPSAPNAPAAAAPPAAPAGPSPLESIKTPAESAKLPFGLRAQLASASAWSPDPKNPPLYLDLPTKDGEPQPDVQARWIANGPLNFVDQYIGNLRRYHGIAMDVGDQDTLRFDAIKLHEAFDRNDLENSFEIYHGTHTSAVAVRFQNHVMPFFSKNLCFDKDCTSAH